MNLFSSALFEESEKIIAIGGGGGKSVLINKFCQELKKINKTALILSHYPLFVPPDNRTFISDDLEIIGN